MAGSRDVRQRQDVERFDGGPRRVPRSAIPADLVLLTADPVGPTEPGRLVTGARGRSDVRPAPPVRGWSGGAVSAASASAPATRRLGRPSTRRRPGTACVETVLGLPDLETSGGVAQRHAHASASAELTHSESRTGRARVDERRS